MVENISNRMSDYQIECEMIWQKRISEDILEKISKDMLDILDKYECLKMNN